MKLKVAMTAKRRRLLGKWLDAAFDKTAESDKNFRGFSEQESREIKHMLDDIYTFCKEGDTNASVPISL